MKDFFRVLQYSNNLVSKLVQFFVFTVIGPIFSSVTLVVAIPLLRVLFDQVEKMPTPPMPAFQFSTSYALDVFQHYFISTINNNGKASALLLFVWRLLPVDFLEIYLGILNESLPQDFV
jgi:hypothetical protein